MMMAFPDSRVRVTASHSSLLATGSIPVEGSSRKMTGGPPIRAMPALSFRLLPPLHVSRMTLLHYACFKKDLGLLQHGWHTCSCGPVYQRGAPAEVISEHSPHSQTHIFQVFLWVWHAYSEFPFPSCDPTEHQTEGSNQCAAAPAIQSIATTLEMKNDIFWLNVTLILLPLLSPS